MINQTYPSELIEHIILDDFSSDNSVEIIKALITKYNYNCKFIRNKKNQGICKSQNIILKLSKGKYFTSLHDDIWEKNRLELLVSELEKTENDYAAICSNFVKIDQDNKVISNPYFSEDFILPKELFSNFLTSKKLLLSTPTALMKTEILKNLGGYDENLFIEDFDMWLKILHKYKVLHINHCLVRYRKHKTNTSEIYWEKINIDCYKAINNVQKKFQLSEQQKLAIINKRFELSKYIVISMPF